MTESSFFLFFFLHNPFMTVQPVLKFLLQNAPFRVWHRVKLPTGLHIHPLIVFKSHFSKCDRFSHFSDMFLDMFWQSEKEITQTFHVKVQVLHESHLMSRSIVFTHEVGLPFCHTWTRNPPLSAVQQHMIALRCAWLCAESMLPLCECTLSIFWVDASHICLIIWNYCDCTCAIFNLFITLIARFPIQSSQPVQGRH